MPDAEESKKISENVQLKSGIGQIFGCIDVIYTFQFWPQLKVQRISLTESTWVKLIRLIYVDNLTKVKA